MAGEIAIPFDFVVPFACRSLRMSQSFPWTPSLYSLKKSLSYHTLSKAFSASSVTRATGLFWSLCSATTSLTRKAAFKGDVFAVKPLCRLLCVGPQQAV